MTSKVYPVEPSLIFLFIWGVFHWGDKRFGDDWPGRIPAQMIAHILYYFSDQSDLVFDPMAGGGVVADTCLAFNRKCWSFDMDDRPDTRPEIEPCFWDITNLKWPIKGKTKPDLIIFDPPYFKKQSNNYDPAGISGLSKEKYLKGQRGMGLNLGVSFFICLWQ